MHCIGEVQCRSVGVHFRGRFSIWSFDGQFETSEMEMLSSTDALFELGSLKIIN